MTNNERKFPKTTETGLDFIYNDYFNTNAFMNRTEKAKEIAEELEREETN